MKTLHSEMDTQEDVTCNFIEGLTSERLAYLVATPPLGNDLLLHAKTCERCAAKIAAAIRAATESGVEYDDY